MWSGDAANLDKPFHSRTQGPMNSIWGAEEAQKPLEHKYLLTYPILYQEGNWQESDEESDEPPPERAQKATRAPDSVEEITPSDHYVSSICVGPRMFPRRHPPVCDPPVPLQPFTNIESQHPPTHVAAQWVDEIEHTRYYEVQRDAHPFVVLGSGVQKKERMSSAMVPSENPSDLSFGLL
ncbi:hypothetical protein F4776DRAFT_560844 [Hypoxylon sp. NC0597]|nr:hypothetical protein F4776DRAFT_560844 [Hypoxylon sp. NC0597]